MRWLLLFALLPPVPRPGDCPFVPRDIAAARSRIEHQAIIEGLVVNHGEDSALEVRAVALDPDGKETGAFDPVKVDKLSAGRAMRLKLVLKNQPNFSGYRLTCLAGDQSWSWVAREIQKEPVLEKSAAVAAPESDVSIAGVELLFGRMVNRSYTGDVVALRLRIPKPLDGKLTVKVTYEGKRVGDLSEHVNKTDWKTDASKVFEKEAVPKVVAYDAKRDQVMVTLFNIKKETPLEKLRFDVVFETPKQKWTWEGLTDPFLALK
jgi:hypothetical protein